VQTGRCGGPRWVELLGAGLAAVAVSVVVAVNTLASLWKLARIDIFDHTGSSCSRFDR